MYKILQVVSCLEKGGTEAFIMNNYRHIDRSKYSFDFLVFTSMVSAYEDEIKGLGGGIFFCGTPEAHRILHFIKNIVKCIKDNGPYDAVHAHVNISNGNVLLAAKLAGVPIRVSHSHDTSGKDSKHPLRKIYIRLEEYLIKKYATDFLACSRAAGDYLYGKDHFEKYGKIIRNGIDVDKFIQEDLEKTIALKEEFRIKNEIIFGNITRFEKKKNSEFTVDVFNEILKIKPNSILLLGGVDGGQLQYIKDKVKELGIDEHVRFIGVRDDVSDCLKLMDIYLFPSLFEGLGIVLLEAQASGILCFASTGVSREVDVGLGLINFLDLSEGAKEWAKTICENLDYKSPNEETIRKVFKEKGYCINDSVKELEKIYGT